MKILVTGVKGQLGYDVMKVLHQRDAACLGADIEDFDITDAAATAAFIERYAPDAVIHCSAYTAVDRAEEEAALCESMWTGRAISRQPAKKSALKWFISALIMYSPALASAFMKQMILLGR